MSTGNTEAVPEDSMDSPRSTTSAMSGVSMTSQGTPRTPFRRAVGYAEAAVGLTGQYLLTLTPSVCSSVTSLVFCWWVAEQRLCLNPQICNVILHQHCHQQIDGEDLGLRPMLSHNRLLQVNRAVQCKLQCDSFLGYRVRQKCCTSMYDCQLLWQCPRLK